MSEQIRATASLEEVADRWMGRKGVVSVEVARSRRDQSKVAIRVTVERKLPVDQVPVGELFPRSLDGFPVELVEGVIPSIEQPGIEQPGVEQASIEQPGSE